MPTALTPLQLKTISTNANGKYLWSTFLEESTDSLTGTWIDPLSPKILKLLTDLDKKEFQPIQWRAGELITNVSHQLYRTTSLWAVILYLNGYMHPDEIPDGATMFVPKLSNLDKLFTEKETQTNYGKEYVV